MLPLLSGQEYLHGLYAAGGFSSRGKEEELMKKCVEGSPITK